jgi:hypothetical protein
MEADYLSMVALGFKEARANRNARETKKKYE